MKNRKIDLVELDQTIYYLKCVTNNVNAVHTAMVEGCSSADEWRDALYFAYLGLWELTKKFEAIMQEGAENNV